MSPKTQSNHSNFCQRFIQTLKGFPAELPSFSQVNLNNFFWRNIESIDISGDLSGKELKSLQNCGISIFKDTLSCRIEAMGGIAAIAVLFGKPCS